MNCFHNLVRSHYPHPDLTFLGYVAFQLSPIMREREKIPLTAVALGKDLDKNKW